jgi:GDPmannose 4,6-dehydratase
MAFAELGVEVRFEGEGEEEKGYIVSSSNPEFKMKEGQCIVEVDSRYFRPTEVELLIGDPTKSQEQLGWIPKYDLPALVKDMMQSDLELFKRDAYLKAGGHKVLNYHE